MGEYIFGEIEYWLSKGMSAEDCAKALCDIYGKDYENAKFLVSLCK